MHLFVEVLLILFIWIEFEITIDSVLFAFEATNSLMFCRDRLSLIVFPNAEWVFMIDGIQGLSCLFCFVHVESNTTSDKDH